MLLKVADNPPDPSHVTGSVTNVVAAVATTMPSWSAAFPQYIPWMIGVVIGIPGFLYYCIGLWETRTVQNAAANWQTRHKARKIARLKRRERVIRAELDAMDTVRAAKAEAVELVERERVEAKKEEAAAVTAVEKDIHGTPNGPTN